MRLSKNRTLIERLTGIDKTTIPEMPVSVSFEPSARDTLLGVTAIIGVSIVLAALIKSKTN